MKGLPIATAFILVFSLSLLTADKGGQDADTQETSTEAGMLSIEMDISSKETSKDSHWSRCVLKIENGRAKCQWTYGGFKAPKNKNSTFSVSPSVERKIIRYITARELNRSIEEHGHAEGIGVSVRVGCTIRLGEEVHTIEIQGMLSPWGANRDRIETIQNRSVYRDLATLANAAEYSFEKFPDENRLQPQKTNIE